jgi:hypothetical protein
MIGREELLEQSEPVTERFFRRRAKNRKRAPPTNYKVVHKFVEKFNLHVGLRTLNWVKLKFNFKFEG